MSSLAQGCISTSGRPRL